MLITGIGLTPLTLSLDPLTSVKALVHSVGGILLQADVGVHEDAGNAGHADQWADQSGNAFTASQGTDANDPQISTLADGRTPALACTGIEGFTLDGAVPIQAAAGSWACYLVCEPASVSGTGTLFYQVAPTLVTVHGAAVWDGGLNPSCPAVFDGTQAYEDGISALGLQLLEFRHDQAAEWLTISRNGIPICDEAFATNRGLTAVGTQLLNITGAYGFNGKVRDLIWINKSPTPANELAIYNGLAAHTPTLPTQGVWDLHGTVLENATADGQWGPQESNAIIDTSPQILTGETSVIKIWYTDGLTTDFVIGYAEARLSDPTTLYRHPSNPILTLHTRCGQVRKRGGIYYMTAFEGTGSLDFLTSANGIAWTVATHGAVPAGGGGAPDEIIAGNSCLVDLGGSSWAVLYDACAVATTQYQVFLSVSTDNGATWTKHGGGAAPVIGIGSVWGSIGGPFAEHVGAAYYCWCQASPVGDAAPTDLVRYSAAAMTGPWTRSSAGMSLWRHRPGNGWRYHYGQIADCTLFEYTVSGVTKVGMYYSGLADARSDSHLEFASFDGTLADLVATDEGIAPGEVVDMLRNPSFEVIALTIPGGDVFPTLGFWFDTASDGAIVRTKVTAEVHTDTSRIAACKLTAGAGVDTRVYQAITGLLAGESYTLTGWARGDGTHGGRIRVQNSVAADLITWPTTTTTSATYTAFTATFTAPANGQATVSLYCPATAAGYACFDDLSLKLT